VKRVDWKSQVEAGSHLFCSSCNLKCSNYCQVHSSQHLENVYCKIYRQYYNFPLTKFHHEIKSSFLCYFPFSKKNYINKGCLLLRGLLQKFQDLTLNGANVTPTSTFCMAAMLELLKVGI
jgi:hypothetical protein